jgi:hypothetical protein
LGRNTWPIDGSQVPVRKEVEIRDDMTRVARRAGTSLRQLAEVSGLGHKTVTAIVGPDSRVSD